MFYKFIYLYITYIVIKDRMIGKFYSVLFLRAHPEGSCSPVPKSQLPRTCFSMCRNSFGHFAHMTPEMGTNLQSNLQNCSEGSEFTSQSIKAIWRVWWANLSYDSF